MPMPPEIALAMSHLDAQSEKWSEETRAHWLKFRGYARKTERISQTTLPAVGQAAQEMIMVREHAHKAIEHMQGVFGPKDDENDDGKR